MSQHSACRRCHRMLAVLPLVAVSLGGVASAMPIGPGFDLLKAQPGSHWDFASEPIPPGFFGPGSDPFEGQVAMITLTQVRRLAGADFALGQETVPVEILSMGLHSVSPIEVTFGGGRHVDSFFDVFVTLDTTPTLPPNANTGQLLLAHNPPGSEFDGGTIAGGPDSFFDVFVEMQFTGVGGGGPMGPLMADPLILLRSQHVTLAADAPWAHTAPPEYFRPDSGGFFPGVDPAHPGLPPQQLLFQGSEFSWQVRLDVIPEPATVTLLALGGITLLRRRRRG